MRPLASSAPLLSLLMAVMCQPVMAQSRIVSAADTQPADTRPSSSVVTQWQTMADEYVQDRLSRLMRTCESTGSDAARVRSVCDSIHRHISSYPSPENETGVASQLAAISWLFDLGEKALRSKGDGVASESDNAMREILDSALAAMDAACDTYPEITRDKLLAAMDEYLAGLATSLVDPLFLPAGCMDDLKAITATHGRRSVEAYADYLNNERGSYLRERSAYEIGRAHV